jgi:hypothetical protein
MHWCIEMSLDNSNHEIEELPTGARFTGFNARYPGPPAAGMYSSIIHNFTNQVWCCSLCGCLSCKMILATKCLPPTPNLVTTMLRNCNLCIFSCDACNDLTICCTHYPTTSAQLYLETIVQGQPMDDEFDPMGAFKNMWVIYHWSSTCVRRSDFMCLAVQC